ncbi:hypothetical protein P154DRAFT_524549 [Amniculicola lignicola CBS 123094]|uniref:Uncharacterized protein n=1 Tax=Amniculicola lignicola CBS 123094 TaxID=1392246 RepID=A0A6A5W7U7_9PLEO|nr:hypothetical protein P154DRAFT_524549 [Amniculicola lignicola CBS 123094]
MEMEPETESEMEAGDGKTSHGKDTGSVEGGAGDPGEVSRIQAANGGAIVVVGEESDGNESVGEKETETETETEDEDELWHMRQSAKSEKRQR